MGKLSSLYEQQAEKMTREKELRRVKVEWKLMLKSAGQNVYSNYCTKIEPKTGCGGANQHVGGDWRIKFKAST